MYICKCVTNIIKFLFQVILLIYSADKFLFTMADLANDALLSQVDDQKACVLYKDISMNMNSVTELVDRLTKQVNAGEFDTKKVCEVFILKFLYLYKIFYFYCEYYISVYYI